MASYSLNITDNGNGYFTVALLRSPTTVASGGTSITLPVLENVDGSYYSGATKHLDDAFMKGMRGALNDRSTSG